MKSHKGLICFAVFTTCVVMMLTTVQYQFRAGRGFICLKCGRSSFSNSRDVHPYSQPQKQAFSEKWFGSVRTNKLRDLRHFTIKSNATQLSVPNNSISLAPCEAEEVIRVPANCVENNCREFLSDREKIQMGLCEKKAESQGLQINDSDCRFLPSTGRHPVALISAPGSGNTWTRGLLEKATGICTGFIYCDTAMRANGYVGEMLKSARVLVVKIHSPMSKWRGSNNTKSSRADSYYSSAIFILRNPIHSAIAEWNRRSAERTLGKHNSTISKQSHTYVVPKTFFSGKAWDDFLHLYMKEWKLRLHQWVIDQDTHPVHILRYEDLKKNAVEEVKKALDFLKVCYNSDTLADKVKEDYSEYHRPHSGDNFEHYTEEQKQQLKAMLLETMEAADKAGKSQLLRLDQYLLTLKP